MNAVAEHLRQLRVALAGAQIPFDVAGAQSARSQRSRGVDRLDDHIIPRYDNLDAPLLCVVGGSTGAGKSTLFNSLLGQKVAATAAVRPTTRRPLLVYRPETEKWFASDRILPSLARVRVDMEAAPSEPTVGSSHELEIRAFENMPRGIAFLDAPDVDSIVDENRELAQQLLDAADLWVFVTTAARYADALPWRMLREAAERDITITIVLNRIPPGATEEIRSDLLRLLADEGLAHAPVVCIEETQLQNGFIPAHMLSPLANWLAALSSSTDKRMAAARRALRGSVKAAVADGQGVVEALIEQGIVAADAHTVIDNELAATLERIKAATRNGSLLRDEVLARWQEVVGAADISRRIDASIAWLKRRITGLFTTAEPQVESMNASIGQGLATMLGSELLRGEERIRRSWRQLRAMGEVEGQVPVSDDQEVLGRAQDLASRWQRELFSMVSEQAGSRKTSARFLAMGVNLIGLALMIVIFASTGGLSGAEVGVAGATSVVAQRLLESVFGDQAVAQMTKAAHELLLEYVETEARSVYRPLREAIPEPSDPSTLAEALAAVEADWQDDGPALEKGASSELV